MFDSRGLVIDKATRLPLDSVKINIKSIDSVFTDSIGKYNYHKMVYGYAGEFEMLLSKKGYKTKHVNFKNDKIDRQNALIEMEKLEKSSKDLSIKKEAVSKMYFVNLFVISIFNLLTLLFIIFKKRIKRKILWIAGILLFNITLFFSITDGSLSGYKLNNY